MLENGKSLANNCVVGMVKSLRHFRTEVRG